MDSSNQFEYRVTRRRQYRVNTSKHNEVKTKMVSINPMAENILNRANSVVKYEFKVDEGQERKIRDVKNFDKDRSKLSSNSSLNQDVPVKVESVDDDESVMVYADNEKPVQSNGFLNENVECNVSSKVQISSNQAKISVEHQKFSEILHKDLFQSLKVSSRVNDASGNQCLVVEAPTKRQKTQSQTSSDVSLKYCFPGLGNVKLDTKQVSNAQILNIVNSDNREFHLNSSTNDEKVLMLNILKVGAKIKAPSVDNHNNVCKKHTQRTNKLTNSIAQVKPTDTLVAQPVKKVILVQLDPAAVDKILGGSSIQLKYPIRHTNNSNSDNSCNSGSKESHNYALNLPTPQPDVSLNRSTEESSTEALPAVNDTDQNPFLFVSVDGV